MRILMISDHADPLAEIGSKEAGGQNIYVYSLAKYLTKLGYFVDIYTRYDKKNKKEVVRKNHHMRIIRVKAGPKKYIPRDTFLSVLDEFADNILKRIKEEKINYDVVHSNYWFSGLAGIRISKEIGVPMVHVYHSIGKIRYNALKNLHMDRGEKNFFQKRTAGEQIIATMADRIIATSPVEKKLIKKVFNIPLEKIKAIPIGIDLSLFKPVRARKILKKNSGDKIILYVGRLEWRKGVGTLLYSLREILNDFPAAKLYIIGGAKNNKDKGSEQEELQRQLKIIEELGLEKNVIYLGPRTQAELAKYYSIADVCVVPSYYEPFGIVPLESMACGTPVVASKTGGLQYSVKDGETGYLAKPRDYKDLAKKLNLILKKGKMHFYAKCLNRIRAYFTWDQIVFQYKNYLESLMTYEERKDQYEDSNVGALRRVRSTKKVRWN